MPIFLVTIGSLILLSSVGIYHLITNYDPDNAIFGLYLVLFSLLAVLLTCILTIILFWFKIRFIDRSRITLAFKSTLRQAIFISACLVILLILYIFDIFSYWSAIPIILAFIFLELLFLSEKVKSKTIDEI